MLLAWAMILGLCACGSIRRTTAGTPKDFAPLVRFVDVNVGEAATVTLSNGETAAVKLLAMKNERDPAIRGIWRTTVTVEVNGAKAEIVSGVYNLPRLVGGVQIDCTATGDLVPESHVDHWDLHKDARLRLWPRGSRWIAKGTFTPPLQERMFAGTNWYDNILMSPQGRGKFYYHAGMDTGAVEKLTPVVAATDGLLVQLGEAHLDAAVHKPIAPRYDVIYIRDDRGWYYRYSHLSALEPALKLGERVKLGQRIGYVGKEGESGGWTHLHFEIVAPTPGGGYGTQGGYVYWLQAYIDTFQPAVVACAQPRRTVAVGEELLLDASRSWSRKPIATCQWQLDDGTRLAGATVPHVYRQAGGHREILKVTDVDGNCAYDVMLVNVIDRPSAAARDGRTTGTAQRRRAPGVQAFYYPTLNIKPGDPVVFSSRGTGGDGCDVYDFDDGTTTSVRSNIDRADHAENGYAMTVHHFKEARYYFVKVRRTDPETGQSGYHLMIVPVGIKP